MQSVDSAGNAEMKLVGVLTYIIPFAIVIKFFRELDAERQ